MVKVGLGSSASIGFSAGMGSHEGTRETARAGQEEEYVSFLFLSGCSGHPRLLCDRNPRHQITAEDVAGPGSDQHFFFFFFLLTHQFPRLHGLPPFSPFSYSTTLCKSPHGTLLLKLLPITQITKPKVFSKTTMLQATQSGQLCLPSYCEGLLNAFPGVIHLRSLYLFFLFSPSNILPPSL